MVLDLLLLVCCFFFALGSPCSLHVGLLEILEDSDWTDVAIVVQYGRCTKRGRDTVLRRGYYLFCF